MRAFVGVTDRDWFIQLSKTPALEEVNFWQPSADRAFQAGSCGYLLKSVLGEELARAIHTVYGGQRHIPPGYWWRHSVP